MMNQIRKMIREKGQGLTEYVLILAFIAGVAFMMFGGNGSLKGTVVGTVTETNRILGGLFEDETDWGHADRSTFNDSNKLERYDSDQKALANLAGLFLNKTKAEVNEILGVIPGNNAGTLLGWFVEDSQGQMHFLTKTLNSSNDELSGSLQYGNTLRSYNDRIFNWMQGDYGVYGESGAYQLGYDSTNNYLVSDYVNNQLTKNYNWGEGTDWGPGAGGNGVKLNLHYDSSGKVDAARIAIDQGSQNKSSTQDDKSLYSSSKSNGLEVTVKSSQEGYTVTRGFQSL